MRKLIALAIFVFIAVTVSAQEGGRIAAHMRFLSSDLLEGRGTGTRGYMIAAQYVAGEYEKLGLEPGASGSYFQSVPFVKTTAGDESYLQIRRNDGTSMTMKLGIDFATVGDPVKDQVDIDAPVVYAGYGITAPPQKYDDYANLDVHGKVVAIFGGAPASFPSDLRAHFAASITKMENAAAHGAAAVVFLRAARDEARAAWPRVVRQYQLGTMNWLDAAGTARGLAPITSSITLSAKSAEQLFDNGFAKLAAAANTAAEKGYATGRIAKIHLVSKHERVASPNVVGILRGTDLANEYVVYSAHLDHLGISAPLDGDSINNGALDNASGIGAMLEVARLFAEGKRPRRSILFLATTGEEKGLKGADYFANNPTVPASAIVADINIDEIFMFAPTRDVVPIGGEHSTLGDAVAHAAAKMNLEISPDPQPEEVVFVRSDQYPFVKRGIPAVYVGSGYKPVDPKVDLVKAIEKWEETIYHTPKDDMTQPLDFSVGAMVAKFDYLLGDEVANAAARPKWRKGDFFGEMFGAGR
jgi:Zn-dependent M28 family amino/carboxypeptidase